MEREIYEYRRIIKAKHRNTEENVENTTDLIAGIVVGGIVILPKLSAMLSHMQTLIDELQPTIDGFNQFDYETLNTTLSELKDAISSMNRFLSVFR